MVRATDEQERTDMTMHRILTGSALALLVAATLTACGGGGGGGDGVATLGDGTATTEGSGSGAGNELTDAEREDAMLEFTDCMREHGVDMPDPTSGGPGGKGGVGAIEVHGEGPGGDSTEFEAANEACRSILDDAFGAPVEPSAEEQAQMEDDMLAFAQCMRDHGVDMPDPDFSAGGGRIQIGSPGASDPSQDRDFDAAQTACQDELGFEGGKGPMFHTETGGAATSRKIAGGGS
jgi:hypothetical protein